MHEWSTSRILGSIVVPPGACDVEVVEIAQKDDGLFSFKTEEAGAFAIHAQSRAYVDASYVSLSVGTTRAGPRPRNHTAHGEEVRAPLGIALTGCRRT